MAVVNVTQSWEGRNSHIQQEQGIAATSSGTVKKYTDLLDSATNGEKTALRAAGIPSIADAHPSSTSEKAWSKRAEVIGPLLYGVTVEYTGKDSPLLDPYEISGGSAHSTEQVDRDAEGNTICNPNGERLAGLTRKISDPFLSITRNEATRPSTVIRNYTDAVNSDTFDGWPAGQAYMDDISFTRVVDGTTYYYRVTYKILFRSDGWEKRVLCEGHTYWTGKKINGKRELKPFLSGGKNDPKAHPLDAEGKALANEEDAESHVWLEKEVCSEQAFASLGLL